MNRKILAAAVSSAVFTPLIAQADEGAVTVYGQANAAVEITDTDAPGSSNTNNVASNGSRLGIKGWEGLGNGLKGVFLMEAGVGLDNGTDGTSGSLFGAGRDGYVGVAGGFGTVALGFHGQPYKTSTNQLDVFGDTIADYSAIMNGGSTSLTSATTNTLTTGANVNGTLYDSGIGNSVMWFLPNFNGLSGHLQYGTDETAGSDNDIWGAQFNYSNGPWYVTYAHADVDASAADADRSADKIGASFTFGGATTIGAIYENLDSDGAYAAAAHTDHDAWYLSVAHNIGNNTLKLAYANADDDKTTDSGASYWALGAEHHLSKRTHVYALYTRVNNDSAGTYGLGATGSSNATGAVGAGQDPDSFAVGVKHNF